MCLSFQRAVERVGEGAGQGLALPEPINVAFALGVFAGLRTGELLGLKWEHVDLKTRRIHVRESVAGPLMSWTGAQSKS